MKISEKNCESGSYIPDNKNIDDNFKDFSVKRLDNEKLFYNVIKKYGGRVSSDNFSNTVNFYENPVAHLKFAPFEKSGFVSQCFSTRLGGTSSGMYESMNLTFNDVGQYKADARENVLENFRRMSSVINIPVERMVYSKQTHTTNALAVSESHAGMGLVRERDFDNIDGFVSNTPGLCLVTSFADCIPVVMTDERHRCIASVHAGWRGTVGNIAANALLAMRKNFGSSPKDVTAFIGPGICADCYEVGEDVAEQFKRVYNEEECRPILLPEITEKSRTNASESGKFLLNLSMANYFNLLRSGVLPENIYVSDKCTCCKSRSLFSHWASRGKPGILCNFISINCE